MPQLWERRMEKALTRAEKAGRTKEWLEEKAEAGGLGSNLAGILGNIAGRKEERRTGAAERWEGVGERRADWRDDWRDRWGLGDGNGEGLGYGYPDWFSAMDRDLFADRDSMENWETAITDFKPGDYAGVGAGTLGRGGVGGTLYGPTEAAAFTTLQGLGGAEDTGGEFTELMKQVQQGGMKKWNPVTEKWETDPMLAQLQSKYGQALAPGLTGAGLDYYNKLSTQMASIEREQKAEIMGELATRGITEGSMEWNAKEHLYKTSVENREALLSGIKREDAKEAANFFLTQQGFLKDLTGEAVRLAAISGQTELSATQSILQQISTQTSNAISQSLAEVKSSELAMRAELEKITTTGQVAQWKPEMEAKIQNMYMDNFTDFIAMLRSGRGTKAQITEKLAQMGEMALGFL